MNRFVSLTHPPTKLTTVTASILGGLGFYLHAFTPRSRAPKATTLATARDKPGTFTREALVKKSRERKAHREQLCGECDFPWFMSNCDWRGTGTPLGGGERSVLLEHGGLTIGLMGLIEREWLATLSTISEDELCWRDDVEVARELVL